jgi:LysR family glycine cleavage system transcriptional activator
LTDAGQNYGPPLGQSFDLLADATEQIRDDDNRGTLTVTTLPSIASKWLVPRLGRFRQAYPDIDLRIDATQHLTDFARENVDVAVRYGRGQWDGTRADRLMTEDFFPVCSPELIDGDPPLHKLDDLRRHTLLHDDNRTDWTVWFLAVGIEGGDPTRGPEFSDSSLVLQAAVEGQGVALGRSALAAADLAAGRLAQPFDISLPATFAYYLVCPEATAERPKIVAFRDWLLAEMKQA